MKKIMCLFLSMLMLFSSAFVFPASAAADQSTADNLANALAPDQTLEGYAQLLKKMKINNLPQTFDKNIAQLKEQDPVLFSEINLFGIDLDFLYYSSSPLIWGSLDVFKVDENGNFIVDEAGNHILEFKKGDVALAFGYINKYLKDTFYKYNGGLKFYTMENAAGLTNLIGKLLDLNFVNVTVDDMIVAFGNTTPSAMEFFRMVARKSGLEDVVQLNWCNKYSNTPDVYLDFVKMLADEYVQIFQDEIFDGYKVSSKLLEGMFTKILNIGPSAYIIEVVESFSRSYSTKYKEPALALFSVRLKDITSVVPIQKFDTFSGFLDLLFCDCDAKNEKGCYAKADAPAEDKVVDHFCPLEFPERRYFSSADDDERMLYLYYYLNLCGAYKNNSVVATKIKNNIMTSGILGSTDKERLASIVDGYLCNNFDSTVSTTVVPLYKETFNISGGEIANSLWDRISNSFSIILKKIADYFEYLRKLFSGEIHFGDSLS